MWSLSKLVLDNLHQLLIPRQESFLEMDSYTDKIKSMYDEDPILKQFSNVGPRRSIVDLYPSDIEEAEFEVRGNVLSRRGSAAPSITSQKNLMNSSFHSQVGDVETLDQVANVASHHDTLYSYHYLDETDKTVRNLSSIL
jgi:hypothetical protein